MLREPSKSRSTVCVAGKKASVTVSQELIKEISSIVSDHSLTVLELLNEIQSDEQEKTDAVRWMIENNVLKLNKNRLQLAEEQN